MVLGVNGIRLMGRRSGVGRALEAILRTWDELEYPFQEIRVYTPQPLDAATRLPARARNIVLTSRLPLGLWEQFVLLTAHGSRGVLFCPSYVIPLLARCPTLLAHHGSYEGYSEAAQAYALWPRVKARLMYQWSARRATVVTTVSQSSKRDMVRFYGLAPDRIHIVPEGVDTRLFRPIRDATLLSGWRRRVLGQDTPFILYVGKPTRRRNLPGLLRAMARLKRERELPHKLLLIGTALPGTSLDAEIASLALQDEIVRIGYASQEELALAYNASEVFVYPSSYEGFGMPALEAMACGTPVIALNNTALPEFAGGVAHLLPDALPETLAEAIAGLLADADERQRMARCGPERAAAYDWRIVSRRYLDLLEGLAKPSERAAEVMQGSLQ